jgi:hypothetical protein
MHTSRHPAARIQHLLLHVGDGVGGRQDPDRGVRGQVRNAADLVRGGYPTRGDEGYVRGAHDRRIL